VIDPRKSENHNHNHNQKSSALSASSAVDPASWKTILTTALSEAIETCDEKLLESGVGHWNLRREVELPFLPRRGMVLITDGDEDDDTDVQFHVRRVVYDLTAGAWRAYGSLSAIVPHESSRESVQQRFPDWEIAWIDGLCFDEEGNLLPEEERR
jgi:hypothetical protein